MKAERCMIASCGAHVLVVEVDGKPVAVNPASVEVLVEADGEYHKTTGYLPHTYTCVDISQRPGRGLLPK